MTSEEEFNAWYADRRDHFARAQDDLVQVVARFVTDWGEVDGFRRPEDHERGAVKSAERAFAKCVGKGITEDFDRLLTDQPFIVGDFCRTRLIFRSRGDVEAFKSSVEQRWPLGAPDLEDFTLRPSETGYRALHINGALVAHVRDVEVAVPYEVQVKTVAQNAWGYYTHDSSYVQTVFNQHPRWGQVRALQQLLSDQLHVVDQLQQQIEIVGEDVAHDVAEGADPDEVMFMNVRTALRDLYGESCTVGQAQRLVRRARDAGLTTMDQFAERISPDRPAAAQARESFEATRDRAPTGFELAAELLTQPE